MSKKGKKRSGMKRDLSWGEWRRRERGDCGEEEKGGTGGDC